MSQSRQPPRAQSGRSKAVALRYRDDEDKAPVVVASGYGTVAENIVEIAERKGIPVFRDDSAASLMCMLEVGRSIPPELYEAVAAVYAQILRISADIKNSASTQQAPQKSAVERLRDKMAEPAHKNSQ